MSYDKYIVTADGWTFVIPPGVNPESYGATKVEGVNDWTGGNIEKLMAVAEIAVDNRGRTRKNRYGARSAEPVEGQSPLYGLPGVEELAYYLSNNVTPVEAGPSGFEVLDEKNLLKIALSVIKNREPQGAAPNPTLEDRLMLRHATSYRLGGIVDGEGFMVTVSLDLGCEGWGLAKHWEDPYYKSASHPTLTPQILLLDDATSDLVWCPLPNVEDYHETHTVMDIEDEKEAIRLALDITDGRAEYRELKPEDYPDPQEFFPLPIVRVKPAGEPGRIHALECRVGSLRARLELMDSEAARDALKQDDDIAKMEV